MSSGDDDGDVIHAPSADDGRLAESALALSPTIRVGTTEQISDDDGGFGYLAPRRRLARTAPVVIYLARRLLSSVITLLGTSVIAWLLYAVVMGSVWWYSITPYHVWLGEVFRGEMGYGTGWYFHIPLAQTIAAAVPYTLRLVVSAGVLALISGAAIGCLTALRQKSRFDTGMLVLNFVCMSIPAFALALILRFWGAVALNDFITNPALPRIWLVGLTVLSGGIWLSIIGGDTKRRWITFAVAALITFGTLIVITSTDFLLRPSLGYLGIALLGGGVAFGVVALTTHRITWHAAKAPLIAAAIGVALRFPLQWVFRPFQTDWPLLLALAGTAIIGGIAIGWLAGGAYRRTAMSTSALTAVATGLFVVIDRGLAVWPYYLALPWVNYRPIPTFNLSRPGIPDDFWFQATDYLLHWSRPILVLALGSFAIYATYARASMIEVLNQDYVRTARAKGLPEHIVVVRHALRNALLPITTIAPTDIAGLFVGAIIIEPLFQIPGVGAIFRDSFVLGEWYWQVQLHPYMAVVMLCGVLVVATSFAVDILYALLDPRIRVAE
ncbi:MAG: ABC transporter permease subunit [Promicromonosporaceae bacterium]|nr:ABC transporter permease subunit [Promicromonosporaceae bacterium]